MAHAGATCACGGAAAAGPVGVAAEDAGAGGAAVGVVGAEAAGEGWGLGVGDGMHQRQLIRCGSAGPGRRGTGVGACLLTAESCPFTAELEAGTNAVYCSDRPSSVVHRRVQMRAVECAAVSATRHDDYPAGMKASPHFQTRYPRHGRRSSVMHALTTHQLRDPTLAHTPPQRRSAFPSMQLTLPPADACKCNTYTCPHQHTTHLNPCCLTHTQPHRRSVSPFSTSSARRTGTPTCSAWARACSSPVPKPRSSRTLYGRRSRSGRSWRRRPGRTWARAAGPLQFRQQTCCGSTTR